MTGKDPSAKKTSVNYKAKLERKLCCARDNPEPVFDLSDCNLKKVPNNIFSLCRVFRKDALLLQNNQLFSLASGGSLDELKNLKILDISFNKFSTLPNTINCLESLEVLCVNNNELIALPEEIGGLKSLKILNLSDNKLKSLPDTIGNCQNLEELNVLLNKSLKEIPVSLRKLNKLRTLKIDSTLSYSCKEVINNEVFNVFNLLQAEDNNSNLESTSTSKDCTWDKENILTPTEQQKQQEEINMHIKNITLLSESQEARNKLLDSIKNEQEALDKKLSDIQARKNADRALLVQLCYEGEKESTNAVNRILENNRKMRSNCLNEYEKDRKKEEKNLALNLRQPCETHKILASMDETMRREIERYHEINDNKRHGAIKSLAAELTFENNSLKKLIRKNDDNRKQLIESILADEEIQKSAVVSLLERSDAVSWEFFRKISIVETKLAKLTQLELMRRKVEADHQLVELSRSRVELTEILMDLFEKKKARRDELINRIREMEAMKNEKSCGNNYWLEQYNLLLNSKSNNMVEYLESVHPDLVYQLFVHGVFHYLPLMKDFALSEKKLNGLNSEILNEIGISTPVDRQNVLKAVENFLYERHSSQKTPSAPDYVEPSAPPTNSSLDVMYFKTSEYSANEECVICLDLMPIVIFIPCGHVCTCYKCSVLVALCPICRGPIVEKHETGHYKL